MLAPIFLKLVRGLGFGIWDLVTCSCFIEGIGGFKFVGKGVKVVFMMIINSEGLYSLWAFVDGWEVL